MLPKPEFKLRKLLPCIVLAMSMPVLAADDDDDDDDYVVREYTFQLTDIEEIEIHASVGSLDIVPIEGNEIRVVLEIEPSDHGGWFDRRRDVSEIELESDVRGKRLVLKQTEDGTNTEWTVQMPAVARTSIEMGVGEIDAEFGATELEVDMGVGDVDITLPESSTGDVELAAGVGDVTLRGAKELERTGSFVSHEAEGRGQGDMDARVDVGVGDVRLELN